MSGKVSFVKDPSGTPAVDLNKVRADHPNLAKRADKAGIALSKRGLNGIRAEVVMYVDHSQSMEWDGRKYYSTGIVQAIVDRGLGFALQVDADGVIPVHAFDSRLWPEVRVGWQADSTKEVVSYQNVVNSHVWKKRKMGGTQFAPIAEDIKQKLRKSELPLMAIIVTDGNPNDGDYAKPLFRELAGYPLFVKFLAVEEVQYLNDLDNLGGRVDNIDSKFFNGQRDPDTGIAWPRITDITDLQFADAMVDEWDKWVQQATWNGILG